MRITFKLTPGGREYYLSKFPAVEDLDDVKTDGKIDEVKVRQALKQLSDSGFITWSAGDSRPVCAFAIEFIRQLTHVSRSADLEDENRAHIGPKSKHDETMSRRFDRGVYAFVRIEIDHVSSGIRVRVSFSNKKNIVGDTNFAMRDFAVYLSRIIAYISKDINESAGREIVRYMGVGDASDIFERAEYARIRSDDLEEVNQANQDRASCSKRWQGEFCSPIQPGCRCFYCGRCIEAKIKSDLETFEAYQKAKTRIAVKADSDRRGLSHD